MSKYDQMPDSLSISLFSCQTIYLGVRPSSEFGLTLFKCNRYPKTWKSGVNVFRYPNKGHSGGDWGFKIEKKFKEEEGKRENKSLRNSECLKINRTEYKPIQKSFGQNINPFKNLLDRIYTHSKIFWTEYNGHSVCTAASIDRRLLYEAGELNVRLKPRRRDLVYLEVCNA